MKANKKILIALSGLASILVVDSALAKQYTIETLQLSDGSFMAGYMPGGDSGISINNLGHIAGNVSSSLGFFASNVGGVWKKELLPGAGGPNSSMSNRVYDINNNDVISGWQNVCTSYYSWGNCRSAQYYAATFSKQNNASWSSTLLDSSGSNVQSTAYSLNDAGVATWSANGVTSAISNTGGTVIKSGSAYLVTHLDSAQTVSGVGTPVGMNSAGTVAFFDSFATSNALLFNAVSGKFINAGVDKSESHVLDINEKGDSVGVSWISGQNRFHSFVTLAGGNTIDLSALLEVIGPKSWVDPKDNKTKYAIGWHSLEWATGINDQGQIVGLGTYSDGAQKYSQRVFLITPVPEPETYAMMLAGLGVVGWSLRKRKLAIH